MNAATSSVWPSEVPGRSFVPVAGPSRTAAAPAPSPVLARGARNWVAVLVRFGSAAVVALVLSALVISVLESLPPRGRIGPEAYGRVREGMDRAEVETAVGLPPGDYRDRAHRPGGRAFTEWSEEAAGEEFGGSAEDRLQWEGNEYSISAGFDESGRVTWKTLWRHVPPAPRGPVDEVQRRLGW